MNLYKKLFYRKWAQYGTLNVCLMVLIIGCAFTSCHKSMYDVSKEFYYRPEGIYLGVADSIKAAPGYNRARFTWEVKADPRITQTVIYWNKRQDSVTVDVARPQNERIAMNYLVNNLAEGDYIFELLTKDGTGLRSLPKQVSVSVYGDSYIGNLTNRRIASIVKQQNGDMLVTWNAVSSTAIVYTTLKYNSGGNAQSIRVENAVTQTTLQGLQSGATIQVATSYFPAGGIDTLTALNQSYVLP